MSTLLIYQIAVVLILGSCFLYEVIDIVMHKESLKGFWRKFVPMSIVAIVTEFFDMLGIGSYGPQTACFKAFKLVDDINIPGTLNTAALTITIAGTLLFINTIEMEIMTLIWMVIASSLGAAIGSRFVTKLDVTKIRYAMGGALAVVALIFAAGQLNLLPSTGGELLGLHGWKLIVACVIVFIFGALMMIGIGCYAPTMATICLLGMNPVIAYPVMYGTCAFLIPIGGFKFIKEGRYDRRFGLICNTVGLIGTFTAFFLVTNVPIYWLKWLVTAVLIYTSIVMFRDAVKKTGVTKETAEA